MKRDVIGEILEQFYTEDDLAKILGFKLSTLRNKICSGEDLPLWTMLGRRRVFSKLDVQLWLKKKTKVRPIRARAS